MTDIVAIGEPGSGQDFQVAGRRGAKSIDELPAHYRELLDGPHIATLATRSASGRTQLSPMWFQVDPDRVHVRINTKVGRAKDFHMQANSDIAIQIIDQEDFYHWVTIYGTVVDRIEEGDPNRGELATESIDGLAQLYLGEAPYPLRSDDSERRVLYKIAPSQIVTFGGQD